MLLDRRWCAVLLAGLALVLIGCPRGDGPPRERAAPGAVAVPDERLEGLTFTLRPADERGHVQRDWMEAWFTFSFGPYRDPRHMGFGPLRVINDDIVHGGRGFSAHGHDNLEIFTWVLDGALEHWDDVDGTNIVRADEVQYMRAGRGIRHSEYNASQTERVRLLQIWIHPEERNLEPMYDFRSFAGRIPNGGLLPIATRGGEDGTIDIRQDARLLLGRFDGDVVHALDVPPGRKFWIQVGEGTLTAGPQVLREGDGLAITGEGRLLLREGEGARIIVFDLPA